MKYSCNLQKKTKTGVNRQLLADPVARRRVGLHGRSVSLLGHLAQLRRAAGEAGAQVVARHSRAGAAPRPLQVGLERTLTRLLPPPSTAAAGRLAGRGISVGACRLFW